MRGDETAQTATAIHVDEREQAVEQDVTGVNDVDLGEMNDRIAVRVGAGDMKDLCRMPVQVKRDRVRERQFGQRVFRRAVGHHLPAEILVRDHGGA